MALITTDVTPSLVSTGNINQSTFIMIDSAKSFGGKQATANARMIGIAAEGTKYPPNSAQSNTYAFEANDPITMYGVNRVCLLTLGGTVTTGDLLESDANGAGIVSSGSGRNVGAVALESGVSGEQRYVLSVFYPKF